MDFYNTSFMAIILPLSVIILSLFFFICVFPLPIHIANGKNLTHNEIITIKILTWFGLFSGITWVIALILALTYEDNRPIY